MVSLTLTLCRGNKFRYFLVFLEVHLGHFGENQWFLLFFSDFRCFQACLRLCLKNTKIHGFDRKCQKPPILNVCHYTYSHFPISRLFWKQWFFIIGNFWSWPWKRLVLLTIWPGHHRFVPEKAKLQFWPIWPVLTDRLRVQEFVKVTVFECFSAKKVLKSPKITVFDVFQRGV